MYIFHLRSSLVYASSALRSLKCHFCRSVAVAFTSAVSMVYDSALILTTLVLVVMLACLNSSHRISFSLLFSNVSKL